jgi:Phasin protein
MVAAAPRAHANGKSPVHSIFHMYFSGLEAMAQAYDPFTKGVARAQLELMGLMNRRAQACMEIPSRLSQCRTPQDLVNEQLRFWRTAYEEYAESMGRMTEAMASFAVPSFGSALPGNEAGSAHDYLTFPEPTEQVRPRQGRDRRAA